MKRNQRIICALDIGSSKTCLIMARVHPNGKLEMIASGFSNSYGLSKGVVVDTAEVVASIRRAVEEVESKSDIAANSVVVGISGNHIESHNFRGAVPVQGKHSEVTARDMENAIRAAQSIPLSSENEIIHMLPQEFFVNCYSGIKNPIGLSGSQLDVTIHVISCNSSLIQSFINAANKAQIEVQRVVLQSIASGEAVLTPEEKDIGTVVIDIGSGTTDIAVFIKNSISFASVIPVGGVHFTQDLVAGLRTSRKEAERIKIEHGSVLPERIAADEMIAVQGLGMRGAYSFPRKVMCEYLRARGAELLELARNDIFNSGTGEKLIAGAILTGGGSMLDGIVELAESILEMPVRHGLPLEFQGLPKELIHPIYACAVGLTILEAQKIIQQDSKKKPLFVSWLIDRIMSWIED